MMNETRLAPFSPFGHQLLNELWDRDYLCGFCGKSETVVGLELILPVPTSRRIDSCIGLCEHCFSLVHKDYEFVQAVGRARMKALEANRTFYIPPIPNIRTVVFDEVAIINPIEDLADVKKAKKIIQGFVLGKELE